MKLTKRKPTTRAVAGHEPAFREIISLIAAARHRAFQAVNTELIDLYWRVGQFISRKLESAAWGEGVVDELAHYISRKQPDMKGFTRRSLFRMRQFYEIYRRDPKVSPLVTQLPWTHHLIILSRCKLEHCDAQNQARQERLNAIHRLSFLPSQS